MNTREQLIGIVSMCNSLLDHIENETSSVSESGRKINFEQVKNMSRKFVYTNDVLRDMSDVYKPAYIKMMIFLIKDVEDERKLENALLHILRTAEATNIAINIEEELINSYKIDEKLFGSMMQNLTRLNFLESQMFIIDAMYMLVASDISDKYIKDMIGSILTKLGVNELEMKQLFELINIVVNKDASGYQKLCQKELEIDLRYFYPYTKAFVKGIMADNQRLCWVNNTISFEKFISLSKEEIVKASMYSSEIKKHSFVNENILFQNMKLNLSQKIFFLGNELVLDNCEININNFDFDFKKCKKIQIKNCKITNISRHINFTECEQVIFTNTVFEGNGAVKCFEMKKGNQIEVENCSFVNFSTNEKESYQYGAYFGCFLIEEVSNVKFYDSDFKDCAAKHWNKGKADCAVGGIYGAKNPIFNNCNFVGCKNRIWQYANIWKDAGYMFEFDKGVKPDFKNCTFDKCVEQMDLYRK